jgi:hypothetical protein
MPSIMSGRVLSFLPLPFSKKTGGREQPFIGSLDGKKNPKASFERATERGSAISAIRFEV